MKLKKVLGMALVCAALLATAWSCTDDEGNSLGINESNLRMVFEDDFNGAEGASINTDVWNFDIGNGTIRNAFDGIRQPVKDDPHRCVAILHHSD